MFLSFTLAVPGRVEFHFPNWLHLNVHYRPNIRNHFQTDKTCLNYFRNMLVTRDKGALALFYFYTIKTKSCLLRTFYLCLIFQKISPLTNRKILLTVS